MFEDFALNIITMNFRQLVFPEKNFFLEKKPDFGVITINIYPFLNLDDTYQKSE